MMGGVKEVGGRRELERWLSLPSNYHVRPDQGGALLGIKPDKENFFFEGRLPSSGQRASQCKYGYAV